MTEIIDWPTSWWGVVTCEFQLMPRSQKSQSPWTMRQNVYGPHVQYWQAKLQFPVITSAELAAREAIVEMLGGSAGLLRMGHPFRRQPMYNDDVASGQIPASDGTFFEDGTGWVSGPLPSTVNIGEDAALGADNILISGLPALTSRALRRGDLFEIRRGGVADETPSLHRILADVSSDSGGQARVDIRPVLRKGIAIGDQVVLEDPTTVFRLMTDDSGGATRDLTHTGSLTLDLVEALN